MPVVRRALRMSTISVINLTFNRAMRLRATQDGFAALDWKFFFVAAAGVGRGLESPADEQSYDPPPLFRSVLY